LKYRVNKQDRETTVIRKCDGKDGFGMNVKENFKNNR